MISDPSVVHACTCMPAPICVHKKRARADFRAVYGLFKVIFGVILAYLRLICGGPGTPSSFLLLWSFQVSHGRPVRAPGPLQISQNNPQNPFKKPPNCPKFGTCTLLVHAYRCTHACTSMYNTWV